MRSRRVYCLGYLIPDPVRTADNHPAPDGVA